MNIDNVIYALAASAVVFGILCAIFRKSIGWNLLLSLGIAPFVYILLGAIYSYFHGSGLVGDEGGFDSAMMVAMIYILYLWYITIPAMFAIVISIMKISEKNIKKKKTTKRSSHAK